MVEMVPKRANRRSFFDLIRVLLMWLACFLAAAAPIAPASCASALGVASADEEDSDSSVDDLAATARSERSALARLRPGALRAVALSVTTHPGALAPRRPSTAPLALSAAPRDLPLRC